MKLHKLFAVTLAAASLFGGTLATATPAMARAKKFVYYINDGQTYYHKQYKSMNKYTLNKTFGVKYSSKVKIKHLYVFHVSPMNSRYQTWVKVTGTLYNNGTQELDLGKLDDSSTYQPDHYTSFNTANAGKIPFAYDSSSSIGDSTYSHEKENFQLLYHIKNKTGKLGPSQLTIHTTYNDSGNLVYSSKTLKLNLK